MSSADLESVSQPQEVFSPPCLTRLSALALYRHTGDPYTVTLLARLTRSNGGCAARPRFPCVLSGAVGLRPGGPSPSTPCPLPDGSQIGGPISRLSAGREGSRRLQLSLRYCVPHLVRPGSSSPLARSDVFGLCSATVTHCVAACQHSVLRVFRMALGQTALRRIRVPCDVVRPSPTRSLRIAVGRCALSVFPVDVRYLSTVARAVVKPCAVWTCEGAVSGFPVACSVLPDT